MFSFLRSKKGHTRPKVLLVDDEPDCLATIQCRLEWQNFRVVTATNGKEGLEKAQKEKPDIILLDTVMPVMDGHEMLEQLKNNPHLADIPVIMLTALCDAHDVATASSYGVQDYVAKPFDYTELVEKITNILKTKESAADS